MRLLLLVLLVMVSACKDTQADSDIGLYDPVAPEGSAFVRFINVAQQEVAPQIADKKFDPLKYGQVSSYFVVPEGEVEIFAGGKKAIKYNVIAGLFYTAVHGKKDFVIEDFSSTNRSKATIGFYNLSDKDTLTLKAKNDKVTVLKNVKKGNMAARNMNAVKIDFSIFEGKKRLKSLDEEVIERGNHYDIIYDGSRAQMVTATTNTRK